MRLPLAAAVTFAAAPAFAQDAQFTAPPDGSTFAVGTVVAPTGLTSEGVIAGSLDVTVVIDRSGSTSSVPVAGDPRDVLDFQIEGTNALFGSLADGTEASVIDFDGIATNLVSDVVLDDAARADIATALATLFPRGGTDFDVALQLGLDNGVAAGDRFLFLSDGFPFDPGLDEAQAIADAGGIVDTVALPGASTAALQDLADAGGGSFFDFRANPADIISVFAGAGGGGGGVIGLDSLEATLPDMTTVDLMTNFLGQFTLPDFALAEGANTFTVTATFDDGTVATDTLTLNAGQAAAVIPLPATAWLMLAGLGALGLRRRLG